MLTKKLVSIFFKVASLSISTHYNGRVKYIFLYLMLRTIKRDIKAIYIPIQLTSGSLLKTLENDINPCNCIATCFIAIGKKFFRCPEKATVNQTQLL